MNIGPELLKMEDLPEQNTGQARQWNKHPPEALTDVRSVGIVLELACSHSISATSALETSLLKIEVQAACELR